MLATADPSKVKLLVLDADGTLTDGSIFVDALGVESKRFYVRDGLAMRLWMRSGRQLAVITGRSDASLRHRLTDLGVKHVISASGPKGVVVQKMMADLQISAQETAALGDDLPDLQMLRCVGFPMAVGDAAIEVQAAAAWCSQAAGGHGAVREAVQHLLAGEWQQVVESFA